MNKKIVLLCLLVLIVLSGCISLSLKKEIKDTGNGFIAKTEIESLKFFTAGPDVIPKALRIYNDSFRLNSIDHIWYELTVMKLVPDNAKMLYREVWLDENNMIISSVSRDMDLKSADRYLEYSAGIKTDWKPGYYSLKLFQDSLELITKEFKIEN